MHLSLITQSTSAGSSLTNSVLNFTVAAAFSRNKSIGCIACIISKGRCNCSSRIASNRNKCCWNAVVSQISNNSAHVRLGFSFASTVGRALSVVTILWQSNSGQNTDDGNNDHQFDQGKTFLYGCFHINLLVKTKTSRKKNLAGSAWGEGESLTYQSSLFNYCLCICKCHAKLPVCGGWVEKCDALHKKQACLAMLAPKAGAGGLFFVRPGRQFLSQAYLWR